MRVASMANSKYEYVKAFEQRDVLLPHTWIVIRVDGRSFTRFSQMHNFEKPNDEQALLLMNECAKAVLEDIPDIVFGYGVSDEFSFVLRKSSTLYQRRASKLVSVTVSLFAATYVMKWAQFFPWKELQYAPSFDGRAVCYPSDVILRDYLAWRQVDCHVNNQYNTCYWNLVKSGSSAAEAQALIKGTLADFKNELLHSRFQINYNELPAIFRKGSMVFKRKEETVVKIENGVAIKRPRVNVLVVHEDLIKDNFWNENPFILSVGNLKHINLRSTTLKEQDSESAIRDDSGDNEFIEKQISQSPTSELEAASRFSQRFFFIGLSQGLQNLLVLQVRETSPKEHRPEGDSNRRFDPLKLNYSRVIEVGNPEHRALFKDMGVLDLNKRFENPTYVNINCGVLEVGASSLIMNVVSRRLPMEKGHILADICKLSAGVFMRAIYSKLRVIHFSLIHNKGRYVEIPSFSKDIELPVPLAYAVQKLGCVRLRNIDVDMYIAPVHPDGTTDEGSLYAEDDWSLPAYQQAVEEMKQLNIKFSKIDLTIKEGSPWWLYLPRLCEGRLELVLPFPRSNYTGQSAIIRGMFLDERLGETNVADLTAYKHNNYGTTLQGFQPRMRGQFFNALNGNPKED